ncbi:MAG: response regulator transcription factor [Anaerolineae bacterium]
MIKQSADCESRLRVLVVDDDTEVARSIEATLRRNFQVQVVHSGVAAIQEARRHPPHLIVLDVVMPGLSGLDTCLQLREDPLLANIPILFLTALARPEDRITGFKVGGDDYLTKPFNLEELQLRIQAILRRSLGQQYTLNDEADTINLNGVVLDRTRYIVSTGKKEATLTPIEFELLHHLMTHAGEVFNSNRLLQEVWDYPTETGSPDLVRMHIKNLRSKIEVNPRKPEIIVTIPRRGYTIAGSK